MILKPTKHHNKQVVKKKNHIIAQVQLFPSEENLGEEKKPFINPFLTDDTYHCCKYCHFFDKGDCVNVNFCQSFAAHDFNELYEVAEEGHLSEVIGETFHSVSKDRITNKLFEKLKLEMKLSDTKAKAIEDLVVEAVDSWFDDEVNYKLDENISILYQKLAEDNLRPVSISNPEEFSCKNFL